MNLDEVEQVVAALEAEAKSKFSDADSDKSGEVDVKELAKLMNMADNNQMLQHFFTAADVNRSRGLDLKEFLRIKVCFDLLAMKDIVMNLYAVFYFADANCNKLVEAGELYDMMDAFGCASQDEYREVSEYMKVHKRALTFAQFYECFKGKKQ